MHSCFLCSWYGFMQVINSLFSGFNGPSGVYHCDFILWTPHWWPIGGDVHELMEECRCGMCTSMNMVSPHIECTSGSIFTELTIEEPFFNGWQDDLAIRALCMVCVRQVDVINCEFNRPLDLCVWFSKPKEQQSLSTDPCRWIKDLL